MDLIRHALFIIIHEEKVPRRGTASWDGTTPDLNWAVMKYDGIVLKPGESKELIEVGADGVSPRQLRHDEFTIQEAMR